MQILFFLFFLYLSWRKLEWAVLFIIAVLPAYLIRFKIFGLPSTLLEVMIGTVFFVWFLKNYRNIFTSLKFKILNLKFKIVVDYPFKWEIILLLLVSFIAVGVAGFSNSAFGIWKAYFFEPILFFIVAINVMGHNKKKTNTEPNKRMSGVEKIILCLVISALAVSALAIYQKITGQFIDNQLWAAAETRRVVSFFGYPNAVGLYLGPIVLLLFGWLTTVIARSVATKQSLVRRNEPEIATLPSVARNDIVLVFFIGLTIILSLLSIYFARSEGALVGVVAGLVIFGLMAGKKARLVTLALIIISVSAIFIYQPARDLAVKKITLMDLSGQIRRQQWHESWQMLKDGRLITGAGLSNFQATVAPFHQEGIFVKNDDPNWLANIRSSAEYRKQVWQPLEIYLYPHNIILNFWSELGLAGMLLFVWIIIKYFWLGISNLSMRKTYLTCHPELDSGSFDSSNEPQISGQARNGRKRRSFMMADNYLVLGLLGAMIVIVIHGVVDVPYFKNDLAVMFWLLLAMMGMINLNLKYGKNYL